MRNSAWCSTFHGGELINGTPCLDQTPSATGEVNPLRNLTPFTNALSQVYPRKSEAVVAAQLNDTRLEWKRTTTAAPDPKSSPIRKSAERIEKLLYTESHGDVLAAATILSVALSRQSMDGIRTSLEAQHFNSSTDSQIVENISTFMTHHHASGRRSKETQNAVDAVLVAATFGPVIGASATELAGRLSTRRHTLQNYVNWGKEMKSKGILFAPSDMKQRSDCYRIEAIKAVRAFCHSEEGGRDDTDSKRVYKVADPDELTASVRSSTFGTSKLFSSVKKSTGSKGKE